MRIAGVLRDNLLAIAAAYGRASGYSTEQVSADFYGNRNFLRQFKRGRISITIDKYDKMVAAFRIKWPANANWPPMRAVIIPRQVRAQTRSARRETDDVRVGQ